MAFKPKFKVPFVPPWEDLKMTVKTEHGTVYIFDTCCKTPPTPEQKAVTDAAICSIYKNSLAKRMARGESIDALLTEAG